MNLLSKESTAEFLDRFYSFFDSVLRTITLDYSRGARNTIVIRIAVRDATAVDDGWVCVGFRLEDVIEYAFHDEARYTLAVLSDGLHMLWLDDGVGIDFGWLSGEVERLDELRASWAYAVAKRVIWWVEPY